MKARLRVTAVVLLALLLASSCTRPPFSLMETHSSLASVYHLDREGSLTDKYESLGVFIVSEGDASLQMEVTSPDGMSTWLFPAEKRNVADQDYYGKSGLTLGRLMSLPRGEWSLRVLNSDGRTLTDQFTVQQGPAPSSFHHHLDAEEGTLVLDEGFNEYGLQLLDAKGRELYRSTTTEHRIELTSLYSKWDEVRFVGIAWYDDPSLQSMIVWYDL